MSYGDVNIKRAFRITAEVEIEGSGKLGVLVRTNDDLYFHITRGKNEEGVYDVESAMKFPLYALKTALELMES